MKGLWIALGLCLLLVAGVTWNCFYVNRVADDLYYMVENLPDIGEDGCSEGARAILDYWEKNADYIGLSVGYSVTDRISEQGAILVASIEAKDFFGFRTALTLLEDAIGDMRRLELFSPENLI